MKVTLQNYQKLLVKIQKTIADTKENIVRNVNREKVVMSWKIGKEIHAHLKENKSSGYGEELFKKLSLDTSIEKSSLYKMHSFYETYPKLPSEKKALSWSHYRNLIAVKDQQTRVQLESLVVEKNLGTNKLQRAIAQTKKSKKKNPSSTKLRVTRGELLTYSLNSEGEIDLGFNIFVRKKLTNSAPKNSYTYKAILERVVDGDTLHVKIDLGFDTTHREILRLAKINAAESNTAEGKKATEALKKILKDVPFLIIRTNRDDKYGRYIADVFFDKNKKEKNAQKVANEGEYLNQLLLDLNLAKLY